MSHLIILPSESANDSGWVSRMASHYGSYFDTIYTQTYSHWEKGKDQIDLQVEEAKLTEHLATIPPGAMIIVFAKYAGAILAILSGQAGVLPAQHCFLFGPTFDWANREVFSGSFSVVEGFSLPTTIFHSFHDHVSSHLISKRTADEHMPKVLFITTPGHEFSYDDYDFYSTHIERTFAALHLTKPAVST